MTAGRSRCAPTAGPQRPPTRAARNALLGLSLHGCTPTGDMGKDASPAPVNPAQRRSKWRRARYGRTPDRDKELDPMATAPAPTRRRMGPPIPDATLAVRFNPRPPSERHLIVAEEYPDIELRPEIASLLPVYEERKQAAARVLARDPDARVSAPHPPEAIALFRKEVQKMADRYRELDKVPKVDHDAMRAEFGRIARTDPSAALLWGHRTRFGANVAYANAQRERQSLCDPARVALPFWSRRC